MTIKITKIEKQAKRDRFNIYLDGSYGFSLSSAVLADSLLGVGETVSENVIEKVKEKDTERKIFERALQILSYRSHSKKEMEDKLKKKFEGKEILSVLEKLEEMGLINDEEFTERFVEQSKKGKKILRIELLKKGIGKDMIDRFLKEKSEKIELQNALLQANKVIKKYKDCELPSVKQKIYENLTRKGFSYDIYKRALEEMRIGK